MCHFLKQWFDIWADCFLPATFRWIYTSCLCRWYGKNALSSLQYFILASKICHEYADVGGSDLFQLYTTFTVAYSGCTVMGWMGDLVIWLEATSCQVKFKYLAKLTGHAEYFDVVLQCCLHSYAGSDSCGCQTLVSWSYLETCKIWCKIIIHLLKFSSPVKF